MLVTKILSEEEHSSSDNKNLNNQEQKENKMSTILIILLVLLVLGDLPVWPYSRSWGYGGSGLVGFLLLLVILGALFNWF